MGAVARVVATGALLVTVAAVRRHAGTAVRTVGSYRPVSFAAGTATSTSDFNVSVYRCPERLRETRRLRSLAAPCA